MTWMQTVGRVAFEPLSPRIEQLDILDIAHALGMICRFGGHSKKFYSVAEHSVLVSYEVPEQYAMYGLLHDAAEAYIGDMIRPIKRMDCMADYRAADTHLSCMIADWEGLDPMFPSCVYVADNAVLAAERDHPGVVGGPCSEWTALPEPAKVEIRNLGPEEAKNLFLLRYCQLGGKYRSLVSALGAEF